MTAFSRTLLAAAATLLLAAAAPAADLSLSNKWRIEVSGGARSDGNIAFRVTTKEGVSTDVTAAIRDRTGENAVARAIRDAFKSTLDSKVYHVETDDGEDVLVKKRKGPDFELKFVESTVESVRIHLKKE
jgi:hypothetical protein